MGSSRLLKHAWGGCSIGLLRLIRLRDALVATSLSPEFKRLNVWRDFCSLLQDDDLWELIFAVSRALYPAMRVLRLADCKVAGMEKLYYYVRMTDKMMAKYVPDIESLYGKVATQDFLQILSHEGVAVGQLVDDSDEDEFNYEDSNDEVLVADDVDNEVDDTFSCSSDEEEEEEGGDEATLSGQIIKLWKKRRGKLVHTYSRVGRLLSPNPTIMKDQIIFTINRRRRRT